MLHRVLANPIEQNLTRLRGSCVLQNKSSRNSTKKCARALCHYSARINLLCFWHLSAVNCQGMPQNKLLLHVLHKVQLIPTRTSSETFLLMSLSIQPTAATYECGPPRNNRQQLRCCVCCTHTVVVKNVKKTSTQQNRHVFCVLCIVPVVCRNLDPAFQQCNLNVMKIQRFGQSTELDKNTKLKIFAEKEKKPTFNADDFDLQIR